MVSKLDAFIFASIAAVSTKERIPDIDLRDSDALLLEVLNEPLLKILEVDVGDEDPTVLGGVDAIEDDESSGVYEAIDVQRIEACLYRARLKAQILQEYVGKEPRRKDIYITREWRGRVDILDILTSCSSITWLINA